MNTTTIVPGGSVAVTQLAGENVPYEFDVSAVAVAAWQPNVAIAASAIVRPSQLKQTGFWYVNGALPGQSGPLEPAWSTTAGQTVIDGSCTLTAAIPPIANADSVQSATWTIATPNDGVLTITGQATGTLTAAAFIGGGTTGNVYTVTVSVTMKSTALWEAQLILTIL